MRFKAIAWLSVSLCLGITCSAKQAGKSMPDSFVIAQRTFFDFGPPNDYYELISVSQVRDGLNVERLLITPEGQACVQPAKVESRTAILHLSMEELLQGKNPCAIPEKELHRERKRCKHCMAFSGVNVALQISCEGKDRQIRMDILDRDLFDPRPATPENTSWTMRLLEEIDKATGPGAMEQPMFPTGTETKTLPLPETELFYALRDGRYSALFQNDATLIEAVQAAQETPPPPPSIELVTAAPFAPAEAAMPKIYPPIGRLARIEGVVTVHVDIDMQGKVEIKSADGPKMLAGAATESIAKWRFPEAAYGHSEEIKMEFKLNCAPHVHTTAY